MAHGTSPGPGGPRAGRAGFLSAAVSLPRRVGGPGSAQGDPDAGHVRAASLHRTQRVHADGHRDTRRPLWPVCATPGPSKARVTGVTVSDT